MTVLHLDIETFSEVDLTAAGVYRYAESRSTEVLCFAYAFNDAPVSLWKPGQPLPVDVVEHIKSGGELRAHNAQFERVVLNGCAGKKIGFPEIKIEQTVCVAAKMAASGLPRALDDAAKALEIPGKALGGRFEMLALSKLRKPSKTDQSVRWTLVNAPEKYEALYQYNIQDVIAERGIDDAVPDLIPSEQEIYHLDQRINQRGIQVDLDAVGNILHVVEQYKMFLATECRSATADWLGDGLNPTQREKISDWIRANGWPNLTDMQAETVKALVKTKEVPECVKRVLVIYSTYNAKSVSKLQAMLDAVCADGRLRGMFLYHGAGPGRWSSLIVQLQNLMRPVIDDPTIALEAFSTRDLEFCRMMFPEHDLMKVAGSCTRACLIASPGSDLIFVDLRGIETRFNAWLFDDEADLEAFRSEDNGTGEDSYKVAYGEIFQKNPKDVTKPERQKGKVFRLAFGYEGGANACVTMVDTYGVNIQELTDALLPVLPGKAREHGEWMFKHHRKSDLTHDQQIALEGAKFTWRGRHPKIVQGWKDLKKAAELACEFPGKSFGLPNGKLWFKVEEYKGRRWLHMRLPSGRDIKYYNPRWIEPKTIVRPKKIEDGYGGFTYVDEEVTIPGEFRYWGIDTDTRQWMELSTYGGKLDENGDQGSCSDILRHGMRRLEDAGYPIIASVHDEVILEVPESFGSLAAANGLLCIRPSWCTDIPLAAEGSRQKFYWKG